MFIERSRSIIQDRVLRLKIRWVWIEPSVDMFGSNRDDATVVSNSDYLWRRFVCDGGKVHVSRLLNRAMALHAPRLQNQSHVNLIARLGGR